MRKLKAILALSRPTVALALLGLLLASCDDRPISASAALPQVGAPVPQFDLPLMTGGRISADDLRGQPSLVALWSTHCSQSRRIKAALDSIADARPDLNVLVIAGDSEADVRAYADSAGMSLQTAAAGGQMQEIFDFSEQAPERDSLRVAFALPSFVVVNRDGRVAARYGGPFMRSVFAATDSVLSARQAARQKSPESNE